MTTLVRGVYRDGAFHPDEPVALPDNTPVVMTIDTVNTTPVTSEESAADRERREIHEALVAAGVVRPGPVPGPVKSRLTPERRAELARKLAEVGPIYDIIREERDSN
jgi:hypothetical protein